MVKSYLIDGKSIRSNSQYRGTALRAISRFGKIMFDSYDIISAIFIFGTKITANIAEKSCYIIIQF